MRRQRKSHPDQGSLGAEDSERLALLERNWRRVASTHTIQELLEADKPSNDVNDVDVKFVVLGLVLIALGTLTFVGGLLSFLCTWRFLQIFPLLKPFDNEFLRMIQEDRYYHLLIPVTIPVTVVAVFVNWFSMKLFKHNA